MSIRSYSFHTFSLPPHVSTVSDRLYLILTPTYMGYIRDCARSDTFPVPPSPLDWQQIPVTENCRYTGAPLKLALHITDLRPPTPLKWYTWVRFPVHETTAYTCCLPPFRGGNCKDFTTHVSLRASPTSLFLRQPDLQQEVRNVGHQLTGRC